MASNSEANLSSDFDIDEVINWDEQNYSSKGIEFQLPQLGLPSDVKTSQNASVSLSNLNPAVATSQQTSLQSAQNAGSFYTSFFGAGSNPSVIRNSKSHGFRQTLVSPNPLSFPTENLNIPSINTSSSNSSLLQFPSNLVGQNTSLASQLCVSPLQNVHSSSNLMNDDVSPFTDGIEDGTDLIEEGPLDKIVDQLMERRNSITESPSLSSSYDDDTPVITYSNRQAIAPNAQISSSISPQNMQSRSVLSPNMPSRNVTSPNLPSQSVPSPNAPTQTVPSPVNPSQNLLSSTTSSRNAPIQNTPSTKMLLTNITPSQNTPSPSGLPQSGNHTYSPIQGLSSQAPEQGILPLQTHSKFRLQTPASVPSSIVNTLGQSSMKSAPVTSGSTSVSNLPISLEQTELSTFRTNTSQTNQRNNQSYPSFMLQNPNQTLIRQTSSTNFTPNTNTTSKPSWLQGGNSLEDLLRMQRSIRNPSPNLNQTQFTNQLARSTSVLTNKIGTEQSQSDVPSFVTKNNGTERSIDYVSTFFTDVVGDTLTSDSLLKISGASSPSPRETSATSINLAVPNIDISQYNRTNDPCSESVTNQLQTAASQSASYAVQIVSGYSSDSVSSEGQTNEIQDTSISQDIPDLHEALETTRPLSPGPSQENVTSANQFFLQNFSAVNQSTAEINRQISNNVSQPRNTVSNSLSSGKLMTTETPPKPQQSKSVFTLISPPVATLAQTNPQSQKPSVNSPVLFSAKNTVNSNQPTGITTIKITSPSVNTTGFKYPSVKLSPYPAPKAVSIQVPRTTTTRLKSPSNISTSAFPTFRLTNPNIGTSASSSTTRPMVFTLAPGSQAVATLKNLPGNLKDKLAGRQVIFLQQPSGQPINTPKQQPMKIIFVNDGSIGQVVSGPVKAKVTQSSTLPAVNQTPSQAVFSKASPSSTESKSVSLATAENSNVQDLEAGSPSSVNSTDSDSVLIAAVKQKQENDNKDTTEHKTRGRKRRKDPNRPVKPLSSFQRFFQATQPTIRQQNPEATFAEVSKTIKEMWENLLTKDKKVYQDAWRMERVQYKKAMNDYTASLSEIESDSPSPKQAKNTVIEIKDETDGPVDNRLKTENVSSQVVRTPISTTLSSSTVAGGLPAPRSTGKPLAMMAELANKTKMASAQAAAAKATGMTKSFHVSKSKASNGIEEGVSLVNKKKAKINPLPKKSCIRAHCNKPAKTTKERGTMFCSDDCVMRHCRGIFKSWVEARRQTLKAAT